MLGTEMDLGLPKTLEDVDVGFMTQVLQRSGLIGADNEVVSQVEGDVGLTIGYFSAIKRLECTFKEPARTQNRFVVKTWLIFEALPHETIAAMFMKEIRA